MLIAMPCNAQGNLERMINDAFDPTPQTRLENVQTQTGFGDRLRMLKRWVLAEPAEHHSAAVFCEHSGGAGSGVMVSHQGSGVVVLTNQHVASVAYYEQTGQFDPRCVQTLKVTGDGGTQTFRYLGSDMNLDLACYYSDQATARVTLPVSDTDPPMGDTLEFIGYGGPKYATRRVITATRVSSREPISFDAGVVSGDSGGPIIWNGHLVGINYGAPARSGNAGTHEGWNVTYPGSSHATPATLTGFLRGCGVSPICARPPRSFQPRLFEPPIIPRRPTQQACPDGNCPQVPQQPIPQPAPPPSLNPPTNGPVAPVSPAPCNCDGSCGQLTDSDLEAIMVTLLDRMKADPAFRGEPGKDGEPGATGATGAPGKDGAPGQDGAPGKSGTGIAKIRVDDRGDVYVTFSNGRTENVGNIKPDTSNTPAYFTIEPRQAAK